MKTFCSLSCCSGLMLLLLVVSCGSGGGSSQVADSAGGDELPIPDSGGNGGGIPASTIESPFGFHPASVAKPGYGNNGYGDAQNIGVKWTREGLYAYWFLVQPDT